MEWVAYFQLMNDLQEENRSSSPQPQSGRTGRIDLQRMTVEDQKTALTAWATSVNAGRPKKSVTKRKK